MGELSELVEFISKALVDHPDQVEVTEAEGEQTTVIELRLAKEDLGRVIGRDGRTAKSIRALLSAMASRTNKRTILEILD